MNTTFCSWPTTVKAFAENYASTDPKERRTEVDQFLLQTMGIRGRARLESNLKQLLKAGLIDENKRLVAGAEEALMACYTYGLAEADGLPMAEYRPKKTIGFSKALIPGEEGYFIGKLNGQPCYSNGFVAVLGDPPVFSHIKDVDSFDNAAQVKEKRVPIVPVAFSLNPKWEAAPRRVYFSSGVMVDAQYYDLFVTLYKNPVFKAEDNPNTFLCVLVYDSDELVGLLMPMRQAKKGEDGATPAGAQKLMEEFKARG